MVAEAENEGKEGMMMLMMNEQCSRDVDRAVETSTTVCGRGSRSDLPICISSTRLRGLVWWVNRRLMVE